VQGSVDRSAMTNLALEAPP